jgi:hypothetical protein
MIVDQYAEYNNQFLNYVINLKYTQKEIEENIEIVIASALNKPSRKRMTQLASWIGFYISEAGIQDLPYSKNIAAVFDFLTLAVDEITNNKSFQLEQGQIEWQKDILMSYLAFCPQCFVQFKTSLLEEHKEELKALFDPSLDSLVFVIKKSENLSFKVKNKREFFVMQASALPTEQTIKVYSNSLFRKYEKMVRKYKIPDLYFDEQFMNDLEKFQVANGYLLTNWNTEKLRGQWNKSNIRQKLAALEF